MELNEMEKRLLFQVEGDYQSKVLNELHMTARYIKNAEQKEAARLSGQSDHVLVRKTRGSDTILSKFMTLQALSTNDFLSLRA